METSIQKITKIRRVLRALKKIKMICSYEMVNRLDQNLSYKIYYTKDRYFVFTIFEAKYRPIDGLDFASYYCLEVSILIDSNCKPKKIFSVLKKLISDRKRGLKNEILFKKDLQYLIETDNQVKSRISGFREPTLVQDREHKIDLILMGPKAEIPIQIKSSVFGKLAHDKSGSKVSSIVYTKDMLASGRMKQLILSLPNTPFK